MKLWKKFILLSAAFSFTHGFAVASEAASSQTRDSEMQVLHNEMAEMLDREAIRNLPIEYCYHVHQKDTDAIVDLFTTDGKLTLADDLGGQAEGRDALHALYSKSIADADPWPFVHNHHIVMLGDGRAKGYIYAEIRYGSEGYRTVSIGVYEDEYQKVDGEWKFKSRLYKSHSVPH